MSQVDALDLDMQRDVHVTLCAIQSHNARADVSDRCSRLVHVTLCAIQSHDTRVDVAVLFS